MPRPPYRKRHFNSRITFTDGSVALASYSFESEDYAQGYLGRLVRRMRRQGLLGFYGDPSLARVEMYAGRRSSRNPKRLVMSYGQLLPLEGDIKEKLLALDFTLAEYHLKHERGEPSYVQLSPI